MAHHNTDVELLCSKAVAARLDDIWRWNEDEMSWINSLVLQGRGKCSYCAMRQCFELKMCVRDKKEKQNQIMWSTVPWTTLSSPFDDRNRCLGPGYIVRKFSCPTFQMWNVRSTSEHTVCFHCSVPTNLTWWEGPVTTRCRTRLHKFVFGYLMCKQCSHLLYFWLG